MSAPPPYTHPHHEPAHVMRCYRACILGTKKRYGTARGLVHYRELVNEYRAAKAVVLLARRQGLPDPSDR